MRSIDPEPTPFQPLGDRVKKPDPTPRPQWTQVPGAPKGVEQDKDGRMRNEQPTPKG
jgi:hypothetical protein